MRSLDVPLKSPERNSTKAAQAAAQAAEAVPRLNRILRAFPLGILLGCVRIHQYSLFFVIHQPPKKTLAQAQRSRETLHFTYFTFYLSFSKAARKKPLVSSSLPGSKRCTSLHSSSDSPHPGLPSPPTLIERERERVQGGRGRDRESGTQLDACKQCAMRNRSGSMRACNAKMRKRTAI